MTRAEAFELFIAAVAAAIPEIGDNWPDRREAVRKAGIHFAHAAAQEVLDECRSVIGRAT